MQTTTSVQAGFPPLTRVLRAAAEPQQDNPQPSDQATLGEGQEESSPVMRWIWRMAAAGTIAWGAVSSAGATSEAPTSGTPMTQTTPRGSGDPPPLQEEGEAPVPKADPTPVQENVGHYVPGYTGPKDGLSRRKYDWLTFPLNRFMIAGTYRLEVQGRENLPEEGPHIYCPTHPSMMDPPLVAALTRRDMRYVANIYVFDGIRGRLMTWGGAFPINREHPTRKSIMHGVDVVKQGKGLCIFPEGGIADAHLEGQVGPLKRGAAYFALKGDAESIVPIAIDYVPDDKPRHAETAVGVLAAAGMLAGGLLAATCAGPTGRVVFAALAGTLAGAHALGKPMYHKTNNPEWFDPFPRYFAMMKGSAAGAAIGGVAACLATAFLPEASAWISGLAGVAGAVGAWGTMKGWRDREIARVVIGKPLEVAPFRNIPNQREAINQLTVELHRALGRTNEQLMGVPYDDTRPKFRGVVVETLRLKHEQQQASR
ncbi:MAG: lysophospholipid acyltransferase family protein [Candidatus Eremiobacterota bacterium]